jgi:hypothetical protein
MKTGTICIYGKFFNVQINEAMVDRYYELCDVYLYPGEALDHSEHYSEADQVACEFGVDVDEVYYMLEADDSYRLFGESDFELVSG